MRLNRKHQFSLPLQQQNQFNGTVKESMEARLCLQEDGEGHIVTSVKEKKKKKWNPASLIFGQECFLQGPDVRLTAIVD